MKVIYSSQGFMDDTPAAIDRQSGILYINPKRYFQLTPFQRKFVKFHEYGHYNLNTDSELLADEYAFKQLAGTEFRSLKQCIECLEQILDEDKIGHKVRVDQMYRLAQEWDIQHPQKLNKGTGTTIQETGNVIAMNNAGLSTAMQNQLNSAMNSVLNLFNSLLITIVLIVAMLLILKQNE